MGLTGAGKSTFINTVTGSKLPVGASIQSCTQTCSRVPFILEDGTPVELMDTPGFDDSVRSEFEALETTISELQSWASEGVHAIIYIHRISDNKVSGSALRAFDTFFKMCGTTDKVMERTAIVTNMWGCVSPELGEAREVDLKNNDTLLFRRAIELGAKFHRNDNPPQSAVEIVRTLIGNKSHFSKPVKLAVQRELSEGVPLLQTSAGEALNFEMARTQAKHEAEIKCLAEQYEKALQYHDTESQEEIREQRVLVEKELNELRSMEARLRKQVDQKMRRVSPPVEQVTYGIPSGLKLGGSAQTPKYSVDHWPHLIWNAVLVLFSELSNLRKR